MRLINNLIEGVEALRVFLRYPRLSVHALRTFPATIGGVVYARNWKPPVMGNGVDGTASAVEVGEHSNPLRAFFEAHEEGRGIWKWNHYFDIYHRHFKKFVGREVHVLEVGVYSGGSLDLWKHYFGPMCHVYGVDIAEACKTYENERTKIFVGDQADRSFWRHVKREVPAIDIVIDDGGHQSVQQIVTLEEMLPHIRAGGVYLCEDVHGNFSRFAAYARGLADSLNATVWTPAEQDGSAALPNSLQSSGLSVHLYPFVVVIEKAAELVHVMVAPRHGREWQPW